MSGLHNVLSLTALLISYKLKPVDSLAESFHLVFLFSFCLLLFPALLPFLASLGFSQCPQGMLASVSLFLFLERCQIGDLLPNGNKPETETLQLLSAQGSGQCHEIWNFHFPPKGMAVMTIQSSEIKHLHSF